MPEGWVQKTPTVWERQFCEDGLGFVSFEGGRGAQPVWRGGLLWRGVGVMPAHTATSFEAAASAVERAWEMWAAWSAMRQLAGPVVHAFRKGTWAAICGAADRADRFGSPPTCGHCIELMGQGGDP